MSCIKADQDANGEDIKLHCTDWGKGVVVVLTRCRLGDPRGRR